MTIIEQPVRGQPIVDTATRPAKPPANEQATPAPRKQAESPRAFYERLTKREDVRRLLTKLAKL